MVVVVVAGHVVCKECAAAAVRGAVGFDEFRGAHGFCRVDGWRMGCGRFVYRKDRAMVVVVDG